MTDYPAQKIYPITIINNFNYLLINNRCPQQANYIKSYGIVFSLYLCDGVGVTPGAICYTGTMKRTVDSYYYSRSVRRNNAWNLPAARFKKRQPEQLKKNIL